jgi:maleylacetate reductase
VSARDSWLLADGDRRIEFGRGTASRGARELLDGAGFTRYALLTTHRASSTVPLLAELAEVVVIAEHGLVVDVASAAREQVAGRPLVAFGGGRVIDAAKAIGAAERADRPEGVAAIPTTLSGAELTRIHRQLPDAPGVSIRPSLVICDPGLMASQPMPELAASAMNALAHACEARWLADGNPISDAIAERGAGLLTAGLEHDEPDRDALALGAVEAALAFGLSGVGVHHVVCQTLVQRLGLPHAATNAIVLPHAFALMASRAPEAIGALDRALGGDSQERVRAIALRAGPTRLRELGRSLDEYRSCVPAMLSRPELARTPGISEDDLVALIEGAW